MRFIGQCRDVTRELAERGANAGGLPLTFRLHLLMCRHCRRYEAQLVRIGKAARSLWNDVQGDPDDPVRRRILDNVRKQTGSG